MQTQDITVQQRITDDRHAPATHVGYSEAAGHAWLAGINYGGNGMTSESVAEAHDITASWPGRHSGADDKLAAVIELARQALAEDVIELNAETVSHVEIERVMDDHHVLNGARILVTTNTKIVLASERLWASDFLQDEYGPHGALNVLWVVANAVHDQAAALAAAPEQ